MEKLKFVGCLVPCSSDQCSCLVCDGVFRVARRQLGDHGTQATGGDSKSMAVVLLRRVCDQALLCLDALVGSDDRLVRDRVGPWEPSHRLYEHWCPLVDCAWQVVSGVHHRVGARVGSPIGAHVMPTARMIKAHRVADVGGVEATPAFLRDDESEHGVETRGAATEGDRLDGVVFRRNVQRADSIESSGGVARHILDGGPRAADKARDKVGSCIAEVVWHFLRVGVVRHVFQDVRRRLDRPGSSSVTRCADPCQLERRVHLLAVELAAHGVPEGGVEHHELTQRGGQRGARHWALGGDRQLCDGRSQGVDGL
eukprot:7390885-Prymnesium_polylepis.2